MPFAIVYSQALCPSFFILFLCKFRPFLVFSDRTVILLYSCVLKCVRGFSLPIPIKVRSLSVFNYLASLRPSTSCLLFCRGVTLVVDPLPLLRSLVILALSAYTATFLSIYWNYIFFFSLYVVVSSPCTFVCSQHF